MPAINKNYLDFGLSSSQAHKNLLKFGPNEIPAKRDFKVLKLLFEQFSSFLIIILIISGSISIFIGDLFDSIAIFAMVIINTAIGFIQEYKAENAVKALKKLVIPRAIVIRNGEQQQISVNEMVPDDLVVLLEGEKIPADLEILEAYSLKVDESILTGESLAVEKKTGKGRSGQLFKGTLIVNGRAKARVMSTGKNTEFGKIVNLLSAEEKTRSPLAMQLDDLSKKIGLFVLILIAILFILGYLRGISPLEMLMICVALGVSAIPEGMPIIVTLTLAIGVQKLAKKKAIVRKMNAIETLGATTIICSDKTGTLTLNEMTVKKINTSFKEVEIPGVGYGFEEDKISLDTPEEKKLLEICENCNNAFVGKNVLGDPTEIALKILTRKANYIKYYKELDENTFTSERKMMSTLHTVHTSQKQVFAKGAYEEIIKKCTHISLNGQVINLGIKEKNSLKKLAEQYASEALRVLAFAYKDYKNRFTEDNLIFVGLAGLLDPPRKSVHSSILIAQKAGIKIKIITGDNALTAKAIGKAVGLKINKVATGDQLDKLSDIELTKLINETDIFARTNPGHKYRIVDLLKRNNEVVAVTGDGVNDAPALKHADVGVAMGIKGTEATKEVADIILKDDNFTTIVKTIEEGRRIYRNILSFIKYMLAANFSDIMAVGIIAIAGYPLPLLPLQILWINIATDSLPALALGQSKAPANIMLEKPHPKEESFLKKFLGFILVGVLFQIIVILGLYFYGLTLDTLAGINSENLFTPSHARTLVFTEIVVFELFFAFVCKDKDDKTLKSYFSNTALNKAVFISLLIQIMAIYTPFMQNIFKTVPLNFTEWLIVILAGATSLLVPKTTQIIRRCSATTSSKPI